MSYFNSFQSWLYHTSIYQNLLRELPAPLNNICFDSLFVGKMRKQEASFHGGCSQNGRKLLGRKHFFLEKRNPVADEMQNQMAPVNDYDAAMGAFASEEEQNRQIQRLREQEERQLHSNLESLDASLHGDVCTDVVDMPEEEIRDQKLEKRMNRARREEEKEHRRKEKRLKR